MEKIYLLAFQDKILFLLECYVCNQLNQNVVWCLLQIRLTKNFFRAIWKIEGYHWMVTWLDGRIWTEINVLTSNLILLAVEFELKHYATLRSCSTFILKHFSYIKSALHSQMSVRLSQKPLNSLKSSSLIMHPSMS